VSLLADSLSNGLVAVAISIAALTIVGSVSFPIWNYVYSVSVAWVISDFLLNLIIQGGQGWAKISFVSKDFMPKGKSYLAFFFGIVIGTWLSAIGANWIFGFVGLAVAATNSTNVPVMHMIAANPAFSTLLFANIIMGCLVFVDMNLRFYKKS
jgi:hypothetical protein